MPAPGAPGPYSLADASRVRAVLGEAGYVDIVVERHDDEMSIGGGLGLDESVDFLFDVGPQSRVLSEATDEQGNQARDALRKALEPYYSERGVDLASAAWIVAARAD